MKNDYDINQGKQKWEPPVLKSLDFKNTFSGNTDDFTEDGFNKDGFVDIS